ncbi:MAG: radical SAM protein [Spirochaetales bacterium]|nr:radical SAM protein [Spirochaetales bacterium]
MDELNVPYDGPVTNVSHYYPFVTREHAVDDNKLSIYKKILSTKEQVHRNAIIYIHIPYCRSICTYCHCYKIFLPQNKDVKGILDSYIANIFKEADLYGQMEYIGNLDFKYIHIGGGTPSLMTSEQIERLITKVKKKLNINYTIPINFEGEVRTLNDKNKINVLKELGTSRISFGVQSFNECVRKLCNLQPTYEDILNLIETLRARHCSVNIDLLYGLPHQTMEVLESDLYKAIELKIDSIDYYRVNIYPHIRLFLKYRHTHPEILDERHKYLMYKKIINTLTNNGYIQKSDELFNLKDAPYSAIKEAINHSGNEMFDVLPLGASSNGLINNVSIKNAPVSSYVDKLHGQGFPIIRLYKFSDDDIYTHMALRGLTRSLRLSKKNVYYNDFLKKYRNVLATLKEYKLIQETKDEIKLTKKGILWHQNIQLDFLTTEQKRAMKKMSNDKQLYDKILTNGEN